MQPPMDEPENSVAGSPTLPLPPPSENRPGIPAPRRVAVHRLSARIPSSISDA